MICREFGCPPDVAQRQDWPTVLAVLEFRALEQAIDLMGQRGGMAELEKRPELVALLLETHRAQFGTATTLADLARDHVPAEDA